MQGQSGRLISIAFSEIKSMKNVKNKAKILSKLMKIFTINAVIVLLVFISLELIFRSIYPEFRNNIHGPDITYGKHRIYSVKLDGFEGVRVRVPYSEYTIRKNRKTVLILGDSISEGYGSSYEDIYYVQFQRLVNVTNVDSIQVVSLSGYGNNLSDAKKHLEKFFHSKHAHEVKVILYQYNYNDITPYGTKELKSLETKGIRRTGFFEKLAKWRYRYMNKSVFFRVAQHYAGVFLRNRSGTCAERGLNALGPYTWSFGNESYKDQSEALWKELQENLKKIKDISDSIGARFVIFISPILYDIDKAGHHPHYNSLNLDFSCATINPKSRLKSIAKRLEIDVVDPTDYIKKHFDERIKEGNFTPFFFTADDNHFTPVSANYIAEYLFSYYKNSIVKVKP